MDSSPSWHFDEESGKQSINNPNLNREFFRVPFQMRKGLYALPGLCLCAAHKLTPDGLTAYWAGSSLS